CCPWVVVTAVITTTIGTTSFIAFILSSSIPEKLKKHRLDQNACRREGVGLSATREKVRCRKIQSSRCCGPKTSPELAREFFPVRFQFLTRLSRSTNRGCRQVY